YLMLPIPIYNTIWILLVAYVTLYLPYGMRFASSGIAQIHRELEEAAAVSGAGLAQIFSRIVLPLLAPVLLAGWIYVFRAGGARARCVDLPRRPRHPCARNHQPDHVGGGRQLRRSRGAGCDPDRSARRHRCRPAIDRAEHPTPRATGVTRVTGARTYAFRTFAAPITAETKPPPGWTREAADARCRRRQAAAARLPNRLRFSSCFSLRGGSLNRRAAVPPRMLCLAFSERKGRS